MACVDRRPALGDVTAHTGRSTCASMALVTRMVAALSAQSLYTSAFIVEILTQPLERIVEHAHCAVLMVWLAQLLTT